MPGPASPMIDLATGRTDLVLVGGGHSHALVLRALAMAPLEGLRITLISPSPFTPYSGMLPGLLAGHYRFEETHIDLSRLCQWAGVRFLCDEVTALEPSRQRIRCRERGDVGYDVLSLDIGSQPELDSVPGARQHSIPVKPVSGLWQRWQQLHADGTPPGRIAVVGGGAGSVELALAMAHRFVDTPAQVALYCGADTVLPGYSRRVQRAVEKQCNRLGVALHCGQRVAQVERDEMGFHGGARTAYDTLFWCTGAAASPWIGESGLPVDEGGFLCVRDTLQSVGDDRVFAAGDIATQVANPRPKAGVFAVRQGPVLAHNLRALAAGEPLREHTPQRRFLSLLSLGPKTAVAERSGLSATGSWVWRWKDAIDRRFMRRFSDLPPRRMNAGNTLNDAQPPCGGCGAKVGSTALGQVLAQLRAKDPAFAPAQELDDVAQIGVAPSELPILQSTDQLRSLFDDPWLMGRIAAQHALSDLYASGARPHSALAQITLPFASEELLERDLYAVLSGALTVLSAAGCALLGGHSMQGAEMQLGFTVNGLLDGQPALLNRGVQEGDALLLSKALGTGVVLAAHMQLKADGRHVAAALQSMQESNREAASTARRFDAHAVTDVTGFGLAGHLLQLLGQDFAAGLDPGALPALPGAVDALEEGIVSTLHESNLRAVRNRLSPALSDALPNQARVRLLFDPQTSGGLLMAVPADRAAAALESLHGAGCCARRIGSVVKRRSGDTSSLLLAQ